jgi:hypothetical protein
MTAESPRGPAAVAALALAALTILGLRRREQRLVGFHVQACLVLSPLPFVLFWQVFLWKPWPDCDPQELHPMASKGGPPPVLIFIFDDWSPSRSLSDSHFHPWLPRLNQLAERSFVFLNARSPGTQTLEALPEILFQEPGIMRVGNGEVGWEGVGAEARAHDGLFDVGRRFGYSTGLLGFYLPYAALLDGQLDFCRTFPHVPKPVGLVRGLGAALQSNLQFLPDPLSQAVWLRIYAEAYSRNWFELNQRLRRDVLQTLASAGPGSMTLVHFPLPHAPFVFEEDGRFRGAFEGGRMDGTEADYARQLKFLDLVLGEFQDRLVAAGVFDESLLVVTSDHSWRADPDPARHTPRAVHQVPLLIKWPGQKMGRTVVEPVCLTSLSSYLRAAIEGSGEDAATLIAREVHVQDRACR